MIDCILKVSMMVDLISQKPDLYTIKSFAIVSEVILVVSPIHKTC
jgi:hypothetical protein